MAKVLIVTGKINAQVVTFAKFLQSQQHEPTVLTQKGEEPPIGFDVPVWTYFEKWSAREALKLFPNIFRNPQDICHFLFVDPKDTVTPAHISLSIMLRLIPQTVKAASFFKPLVDLPKLPLKLFLRQTEMVTLGTREYLLFARRQGLLNGVKVSDVIPPFELVPVQHETPQQNLAEFCETLENYLVVPGSPDDIPEEFQKSLETAQLPLKLLFLGRRRKRTAVDQLHFFTVNATQTKDIQTCIQKSRGILLAFSDLSLMELQQYYTYAQAAKVAILARSGQIETFPGLCWQGKTGWILEEGVNSLKDLLRHNPHLKCSFPAVTERAEVADWSLNEINRLYFRVQSLR